LSVFPRDISHEKAFLKANGAAPVSQENWSRKSACRRGWRLPSPGNLKYFSPDSNTSPAVELFMPE